MPIDSRSRLGPNANLKKDMDAPNNAGPYIGIVKEINDPQRMGNILVYIPSLSGPDQDNINNYLSCRYASPFWGQTPLRYNNDSEDFKDTQKSYGMWFPTVDIDTRVLVTFADGNMNNAYWFAVIPDQQINNMVPGGGFSDVGNVTGGDEFEGATLLPTGEINKSNPNNPNYTGTTKPTNKVFSNSLVISGLLADNVRGTTTSSARRESPSQAFGIATPGPLAQDGQKVAKKGSQATNPHGDGQNSRLGGHQFIMDDGEVVPGGVGTGDKPTNEMIKLRTRSGNQILLHDTEDIVYISNSTGKAWIELSRDGKIDIFGSDSISVRSAVDMNFFADRDFNLEAGRNVNIKATGIVSGKDNITGRVRIESAVQRKDKFLVDQPDNSSSGNVEILSFNNTKINADRGEIHIRTNQVGTGDSREDGNKEIIKRKGIKITATGDIDILAGNEANTGDTLTSNVNIEALDDLNIIARGDTQIFSADKINVETQSKFELYADDDINIEAKKTDNKTISLLAHQVGIRADQDLSMFGGRDVNVVAATDYNAFAGTDYNVDVGGIIDLQGGSNTASSVLTVAGGAVASDSFLDGTNDIVFPKNSVYKDESDGDSTALSLVTPAKNADPIDGLTTHILPDALPNDPETGKAIDYPYQKADGAVQARVDSGGNLIIVSVSKRVPTHEPYQQHENSDRARFSRESTDREGNESSTGGKTAPYSGGGGAADGGDTADVGTGNVKPGFSKPSIGAVSGVKKPSWKNFQSKGLGKSKFGQGADK
tara:strand:+ start:339 stop:2645 length:2307 start_codon:yes stop_codon:yes gene_type:complete